MKKFLNLSLVAVLLVLISSCSTQEKINGHNRNNKETRIISLTDDFVPYFKASTKDQRCNALQKWYEHGVVLGGSNTFGKTRTSSSTVTKAFAPAFLDDVFPLYFATQYRDINPEKGKQIHNDITTCNTPIIGTWSKVIGAAFIWKPNSRDFWIKFIDAERNRSLHEKYAALPERATLAPVIHPSGKAPGPFDSENRRYSRVIHSDDRLTVGKLNDHVKKCTRNISYIVSIDLAPDEPITPALSKDIMERVLFPLALRECPGSELTIDASIYSRRFSVTHKGEVVPAGSVKIHNESELADISYSPANQQQEIDPTIYYGGIDYNWPELASINGLADYKKNGRRNTTMAERYSPKRTVRYVNYKPSDTPEYLKNTVNGELIQQIADRDFLGIYRKGFDIDLSTLPNRGVDSLSILYTKLAGGEELNLISDAMAPRKRGFVWAVQAFSELCRSSIGKNPAIYRAGQYVKVGETSNLFNAIVTEKWKWQWDDPVYMDPAYFSLYSKLFKTEKAILFRELIRLRNELSIEQLLAGEAMLRPYHAALNMKMETAKYFNAMGCTTGKKLLQNWAEFIHGPEPRTDGNYPMVIEEVGEDRITVSFGAVPAELAPDFPYTFTNKVQLHVQYFGNRKGGLNEYYAGPFKWVYLGKEQANEFIKTESNEILDSFSKDDVRIINCRYDKGAVNYWLEGFPQPNQHQRNAAGSSFRGSALRCPPQMPG